MGKTELEDRGAAVMSELLTRSQEHRGRKH